VHARAGARVRGWRGAVPGGEAPGRCAQMGGPEGVRRAEAYYVTVQPSEGLSMHAIPRPC